MSWVIAGTALATAAVGAVAQHESAAAQQRQKKAEMMANAAQIQFSPWTGAKAQIMGNDAKDPNAAALTGGIQGGVAGAMMGSQFKNAGGAADPTAATADVNNVGTYQMPQQQAPTTPQLQSQVPQAPPQLQKPSMLQNPGSPYQVAYNRSPLLGK